MTSELEEAAQDILSILNECWDQAMFVSELQAQVLRRFGRLSDSVESGLVALETAGRVTIVNAPLADHCFEPEDLRIVAAVGGPEGRAFARQRALSVGERWTREVLAQHKCG